MLSSFLYFAGAFATAWLVSGILLVVLVFALEPLTVRLLVTNGGALIACELLYRTFDARFFFPRGELIYVAAQLACLGSQWLLIVSPRETSQGSDSREAQAVAARSIQ